MHPYLRPTAPIAGDVILTADPALAMALAQRVLSKPLMANHHHGLWGYSGQTGAGTQLTVQSGGIGAPSTAAVAGELAGHGTRRLIRVGTCAALDPAIVAGEALVVTSARGADGTSTALGAELARPDPELTERISGSGRSAAIVSFDLGAAAGPAARESWALDGLAAIDMETAALFATAERLGVAAAAVLVVAEAVTGIGVDESVATDALLALGDAAAETLADPGSR